MEYQYHNAGKESFSMKVMKDDPESCWPIYNFPITIYYFHSPESRVKFDLQDIMFPDQFSYIN